MTFKNVIIMLVKTTFIYFFLVFSHRFEIILCAEDKTLWKWSPCRRECRNTINSIVLFCGELTFSVQKSVAFPPKTLLCKWGPNTVLVLTNRYNTHTDDNVNTHQVQCKCIQGSSFSREAQSALSSGPSYHTEDAKAFPDQTRNLSCSGLPQSLLPTRHDWPTSSGSSECVGAAVLLWAFQLSSFWWSAVVKNCPQSTYQSLAPFFPQRRAAAPPDRAELDEMVQSSVRMPARSFPGEVFQVCPVGRRPWGRSRRDYIFHLAWECLSILHMVGNSWGEGTLGFPTETAPPWPRLRQAKEDSCISFYASSFWETYLFICLGHFGKCKFLGFLHWFFFLTILMTWK